MCKVNGMGANMTGNGQSLELLGEKVGSEAESKSFVGIMLGRKELIALC